MRYPSKQQYLLSKLWLFVLLNMIFRDLHQLGKASFIEEILSGVVNGVKITDELMLFGGVLAEIPIALALFSNYLPPKTNKWTNIAASTITALVLLSGLPSADLDDIFFLAIEVTSLISIMVVAWKLPIGPRPNRQVRSSAT